VHGDLWSGNLHVCGDGEPALIDAGAVHYGWAEADLAMLTLFGSPPATFFDTYAEHGSLCRDWHERASIYNVYHLLNHVNLFGRTYLARLQLALAA
jgi:fructosamine-3-kinase